MRCSRCVRPAVAFIRYNGTHLCDLHFMEYVEKRVKREVRSQLDLSTGGHITVALSGGKDSMTTLHLLHEILSMRRDVTLDAITVDEGTPGYRDICVERSRKLCDELGVDHHVISFAEEYGITMEDIGPRSGVRTPCSYCGVLRRRCLNRKAQELGSTHIATGLNLDDTVQSVMMNISRGDVERLARLGPHTRIQPGLVPRIQPLRSIPEKETYTYALLRGLDFHESSCPWSGEAVRNDYRHVVNLLEDGSPGTKHCILSSYDQLRPMLRDAYAPADLRQCECGEPCLEERCMACRLLDEIIIEPRE